MSIFFAILFVRMMWKIGSKIKELYTAQDLWNKPHSNESRNLQTDAVCKIMICTSYNQQRCRGYVLPHKAKIPKEKTVFGGPIVGVLIGARMVMMFDVSL